MNRKKITIEIELIVYDFDGVMTDNKVYVDQNGNELVQVNRADGLGISEIKNIGINQIILSTEKNKVVSKRANKLNIPCMYGVDNKKNILQKYCKKNNINLDNVLYVGNDVNDKEVMKKVGFPCCPNDAHNDIKNISTMIFDKNGGEGIVRELFDIIKRNQGD